MQDLTQAGQVRLHIEQGIATVEFGHPAHNSLPGHLLRKLAHNLLEVGKHPDVRVIVLKSEGERSFCAGASFDELLALKDAEAARHFFMGFAAVINACRLCGKMVIGRVQGKAVGGGVGLAAATDYCLATVHASVKLSELAIGIGPFVVGPAVERKIGLSAMTQMTLDATNWKSAVWAQEKGLFAELHDNIPALDDAVQGLAERLAASHPAALAQLKRVFWEGTEDWDTLLAVRAAMSGELVLSAPAQAAIRKFK